MKIADFNTAKTLQELGYDGEYNHCWIETQHDGLQLMSLDECEKHRGEIIRLCAAPRLDDAAYWIREKHKLSIEVGITMCRCWSTYIYDYSQENVTGVFCEIYDDYDSALEAAVTKVIEIIKTNKR